VPLFELVRGGSLASEDVDSHNLLNQKPVRVQSVLSSFAQSGRETYESITGLPSTVVISTSL
jgi:hypothetical protein